MPFEPIQTKQREVMGEEITDVPAGGFEPIQFKRKKEMVGLIPGLRVPRKAFEEGKRNIFGNIFERPAAAMREGLRAVIRGENPYKSFEKAFINPSVSQTFQNEFMDRVLDKVPLTESFALNFMFAAPASIAGTAADIVTNPADILLMLIGSRAAKSAAKPFKMLRNFLTKKRARLATEEGLLKAAELADDSIKQVRRNFGKKFDIELDKIKNIKSERIANLLDDYATQFPEGINVPKFNKISTRLRREEVSRFFTPTGKRIRVPQKEVVTGKELKNIQNEISKTINWKTIKTDAQMGVRKNIWGKIQEEISRNNPKLIELNQEYSLFNDLADDAYSVILERARPGTKRLRSAIGQKFFRDALSLRERQALKELNKMAPQEKQFLFLIDSYRNAQRLKKIGTGALKGAAVIGGAGLLGRALGGRTEILVEEAAEGLTR